MLAKYGPTTIDNIKVIPIPACVSEFNLLESLTRVLSDQNLRPLYLGIFIQHAVLAAIFLMLPQILYDTHQLAIQAQWPYLTVFFLITFLPTLFYGFFRHRVFRQRSLPFAIVLIAMGIFSYAHCYENFVLFWFTLALFFCWV